VQRLCWFPLWRGKPTKAAMNRRTPKRGKRVPVVLGEESPIEAASAAALADPNLDGLLAKLSRIQGE
jgi:hypothetical protein